VIGVDLIGQIRRAFFEQRRAIKEISRGLRVSRTTVRKVVRSDRTAFKYAREVQPSPKLGEWTPLLATFQPTDPTPSAAAAPSSAPTRPAAALAAASRLEEVDRWPGERLKVAQFYCARCSERAKRRSGIAQRRARVRSGLASSPLFRIAGLHATSPRKSRHMPVTRRVMIATATLAAARPAAAQTQGKVMTTETGLEFIDTTVGTGGSPKSGQTCVMHYTGWLSEGGAKGRKFDSSVDRGSPFEFPLGMKRVIAGSSAMESAAPAVSFRPTPR
jgi:hypothetical protein